MQVKKKNSLLLVHRVCCSKYHNWVQKNYISSYWHVHYTIIWIIWAEAASSTFCWPLKTMRRLDHQASNKLFALRLRIFLHCLSSTAFCTWCLHHYLAFIGTWAQHQIDSSLQDNLQPSGVLHTSFTTA